MRKITLLVLLLPVFALAACGEDPTLLDTSTTPPTNEPVGTTDAAGPYGELGPNSVGPVQVGMDEKQVETIFGKPDDKQEVSFAGPGVDAPQLDWVWKTPDGEFRLQFQTSDSTVTGYRSFSTSLKTADGFTVGTPAEEIEAKYGNELGESPIGTGTLMLSEGAKGTFPALVFAPDDKTGKITAIEGGNLQPAGD